MKKIIITLTITTAAVAILLATKSEEQQVQILKEAITNVACVPCGGK